MTTGGLLDGLRVLDASLWQPGHTASQLLADLGAEVIKLEPPGGDRMRLMPDRFFNFNSNKRSVVVDLKTVEGRARALALAAQAEVFLEGFRPGVADRLGVGFEQLRSVNQAIVYCSISGFGQTGPLASHTGHDYNYQAYAGAISMHHGEPVITPVLIGDQGGAMTAAFAILAAVLCARRTGEGEWIDVSMADVIAGWVAPMGAIDSSRNVEQNNGIAGIGAFVTRDGGHVVLGVFSESHLWDALCDGLGLSHLIGASVETRTASAEALNDELARAISADDRDALVARLTAASVPIAPVLTRVEMLDHPHFRARGLVTTAADGTRALGHPVRYINHPVHAVGYPPELDELGGAGFTTKRA
jgi:crotonobetainyl-CoA:carnitine CoA-transferase CaiB-like acyl-CoA transferase